MINSLQELVASARTRLAEGKEIVRQTHQVLREHALVVQAFGKDSLQATQSATRLAQCTTEVLEKLDLAVAASETLLALQQQMTK